MAALCGQCGHHVAFHSSGQGRTNFPCEYPSCDCPDFTELSPTERVEVPELTISDISYMAAEVTHDKNNHPDGLLRIRWNNRAVWMLLCRIELLRSQLARLQAEQDEAVLLLQAFADADDWELKPAIDAESFLARIQAGEQQQQRGGR